MRTTLHVNDDVLRRAQEYAPELNKTALIEEGLRSLVKIRAAQRLAEAVGTQGEFVAPARKKMT